MLEVEGAVQLPGLLYVLPVVPYPISMMLYNSCKIPGLIPLSYMGIRAHALRVACQAIFEAVAVSASWLQAAMVQVI